MDTPDLSEWIWYGCDALIAEAVKQVVAAWKGYSPDPHATRSLVHLIEKHFDPAVKEYTQRIPEAYRFSVLGNGQSTYAELILSEGYQNTREIHRSLEQSFVRGRDDSDRNWSGHLRTLSTIYSFIWLCELKKQKRLPIRDKDGRTAGLNQKLDRRKCQICGQPTQFSDFLCSPEHDRGENDDQRYSYTYCREHKSLSSAGTSSIYRTARRNLSLIEKEFYDILARSNCPIEEETYCRRNSIHHYFYLYVRKHKLIQADIDVVRQHAIDFVSCRITDKKKMMIYLHNRGFSQVEIAKLLHIKHRQSISKALASIPERFWLR